MNKFIVVLLVFILFLPGYLIVIDGEFEMISLRFITATRYYKQN